MVWPANVTSTTKGPGTFVVVFALAGRACALVYHVRTVAAIRALRERGVLFGLCTGRDAHATEAMYEFWGIEGLVDVLVGCGGAEVIDRAHAINELSFPLPGETIAATLSAAGILA